MPNARLARNDATFPLLEDVIALSDIAMRFRDPRKIVATLVTGFEGLVSAGGALPNDLLTPDASGYVRRELYRSPEFGYQVLALTWGPGHSSSVHDHGDTWGVEAVLRGQLEVVDYRVTKRRKALASIVPQEHHTLVEGSVIGLVPPHDLHSCRNASLRETVVTLNVYGTPLDSIRRYAHVEGDLYRPERVSLRSV